MQLIVPVFIPVFILLTRQQSGVQVKDSAIRQPSQPASAEATPFDSPLSKGVRATDAELDLPGAALPLETLVGKDFEGVEFVGTRKTQDQRPADGALCTELVFRSKSSEPLILIVTYLEKARPARNPEPVFTLREVRKRLEPMAPPQILPLCLARTSKVGSTVTGPLGLTVGREVRFSGKISKIHLGVAYDGSNYMVIGGNHVIFADANGPTYFTLENRAQGRIIGFKIPAGQTHDFDGYQGKVANVFALALPVHGGTQPSTIYTLHGNSAYAIELR